MWKKALGLIFSLIILSVLVYCFMDFTLTSTQEEVFGLTFKVCIGAGFTCFLISTITDNYSQVDKLWSIMPLIYAGIATIFSGMEGRIVLMFILISLWGIRLTYNFARRGGYSWRFWSGEEDYRWAVLRAKPGFSNKWVWVVFNLGFISLYQMILIWLFTMPIVKSIGGHTLNLFDGLLALIFLVLLWIEWKADQQQWDFHKLKKLENYKGPGFLNKGIWARVRHPNYAAEQGIWVVIYLFSVSATGEVLNWSVLGIVLLVTLFKNSSDFSEEISASKYPGYADYIKTVPRFLPWPWKKKS